MPEKLTVDEKNAVRILDYWFTMEFLNQRSLKSFMDIETKASAYKNALQSGRMKYPRKTSEDFVRFRPGDNLRTLTETESEAMRLPVRSNFTVFIGRMKKEVCIQKIAQNVAWSDQSPDENNDEIALAAIRFSKDGSYISNSVSISPLAWAMKKLAGGTDNASQKLSTTEYQTEIRAIERQIGNLFEPLEEGDSAAEAETGVSDVVSYHTTENGGMTLSQSCLYVKINEMIAVIRDYSGGRIWSVC